MIKLNENFLKTLYKNLKVILIFCVLFNIFIFISEQIFKENNAIIYIKVLSFIGNTALFAFFMFIISKIYKKLLEFDEIVKNSKFISQEINKFQNPLTFNLLCTTRDLIFIKNLNEDLKKEFINKKFKSDFFNILQFSLKDDAYNNLSKIDPIIYVEKKLLVLRTVDKNYYYNFYEDNNLNIFLELSLKSVSKKIIVN